MNGLSDVCVVLLEDLPRDGLYIPNADSSIETTSELHRCTLQSLDPPSL